MESLGRHIRFADNGELVPQSLPVGRINTTDPGILVIDACPSFRDVGLTINTFAGQPLLREKRLFRGGKIDFVDNARSIGEPKLIINLRRGPDPDLGVTTVQLAADDRLENYETHQPAVQRWLERILELVAAPSSEPPIFVHCAAGRDRTGVAIAALLCAMGISEELIVADYLMTDGVADETQIRTALRGLAGYALNLQRFSNSLIAKFGT